MLRLRRRALRGCGELVTGVISQSDIQNRLKHSSTIDDAAIAIADRVSPSGEGGGLPIFGRHVAFFSCTRSLVEVPRRTGQLT